MGRNVANQHRLQREWRERNRSLINERRRAAYAADPEKRRAESRERERLRAAARDPLLSSILRNDPCSYCADGRGESIDHIVPVVAGGESHWTNFTAACMRCNGRKTARSLLVFLLAERAA